MCLNEYTVNVVSGPSGLLNCLFQPEADEPVVNGLVGIELREHQPRARIILAIYPEHLKRPPGYGDDTILAALALFDVHHPTVKVNVPPSDVACFKGAQAQVIEE